MLRRSLSTAMSSSTPTLLMPHANPVINSAYKIHAAAKDVKVTSPSQIKAAAEALLPHLKTYSPVTWQTQPLHLLPSPSPCTAPQPSGPFPTLRFSEQDKACLDWIFFVSSLNFSFWSDLPSGERWGVEWYADGFKGLEKGKGAERKRWEGYWGLLGVVNSALEAGHPLTSPTFFSNPANAPLIRSLFAPTASATEQCPLLDERIALLEQNGQILIDRYGGSWAGFLEEFAREERGGALDLVKEVVAVFEGFRDEGEWEGEKVCFWKRAQILVAETWAAFHPPLTTPPTPHPIPTLSSLSSLSMFCDYRVPQHLHTLSLLSYSPQLLALLASKTNLPHGSREEMEIRAGSVVAVEEVRKMLEGEYGVEVESVVLDFLIWDLAKEREKEEAEKGVKGETVECHRTRSVWY